MFELIMSRKPTLPQRIIGACAIVLFLPIILPLVLLGFSIFVLHRVVLYLLVWLVWVPRGKDTLFIYSNSPISQEYMTQQVLPLLEKRAVVLNWSERSSWRKWRLRQQVFYTFAGHRDYNPLIVVFRPFRIAKVFRFRPALKDWKHGNPYALERLVRELRKSLQLG